MRMDKADENMDKTDLCSNLLQIFIDKTDFL